MWRGKKRAGGGRDGGLQSMVFAERQKDRRAQLTVVEGEGTSVGGVAR